MTGVLRADFRCFYIFKFPLLQICFLVGVLFLSRKLNLVIEVTQFV